jgi:hypothetical protein
MIEINSFLMVAVLFYIAIILSSANVKLNKIMGIMERLNKELDKDFKEVPPVSINTYPTYRGASKNPNIKN